MAASSSQASPVLRVHRSLRHLAAFVLAVLLALHPLVSQRVVSAGTAPLPRSEPTTGSVGAVGGAVIPLQQQPFYAELMRLAQRWADAPLGQVEGESPRATLLNFYVVMAKVQAEIALVEAEASQTNQLVWTRPQSLRIDDINTLFAEAVETLDASSIPESIRSDVAQEGAIQLKQVLDYVFATAVEPIVIPDGEGMKAINAQRSKPSGSWTLPGTSITLSQEIEGKPDNLNYLFSAETVAQIGALYGEIQNRTFPAQPFSTPDLYADYSYTPGHLVPHRWYLNLSPWLRRLLEFPLDGQSAFQIVFTLITLLIYGAVMVRLITLLLKTYRYWRPQGQDSEIKPLPWHQDNLAWSRTLITLPMLPLSRLAEWFIDEYLNFTGLLLIIAKYFFYVCYFLAASAFLFFLLEALGRSLAESVVRLGGTNSDLQLKRVSNLIMPVSRMLGSLAVFVLLYRLMILIGLPPATVLAFSAVPGLAIGLGASKLLGNLFAGLAIQTDRPVRVGEFCRIGSNLGFVSRMGLRSLELQTLDSRVTIPNSVVDEETILNFSYRNPDPRQPLLQSFEIRMPIDLGFSPDKLDDLLGYARAKLACDPDLASPLVSVELADDDTIYLICFARVHQGAWQGYLAIRERVVMGLKELIDQVNKCHVLIGVSYDTSHDQLLLIPRLLAEVVESDPLLKFRSGRLVKISDFSYDFLLHYVSSYPGYSDFKDAAAAVNRRLLAVFDVHGIDIPFPTAVEIQRSSDLTG